MKSPLGRFELDMPPHYQDKLADLIRAEKPLVVVETGVWEGLGSEYILKALDDNGQGHLYSIDPMDQTHLSNGLDKSAVAKAAQFYVEHPIYHPRFTLITAKSQDALEPLFKLTGPWGMFIHDSDHSAECQEFEYEFAWKAVRSGGIIVSDDPFWGTPPHMTWDKFLKKHGVANRNIMQNAQWIRKP